MKLILRISFAILLCFSLSNADLIQNQKVKNAINVLQGFIDSNANKQNLADVKGVIIMPDLIKSGLIAAFSRGSGILIVKNDNNEWSAPFFVNYSDISVGVQGGYASSDMVILFKNSRAYKDIFNGQNKISISSQAAIVSQGTNHSAATDFPAISAFISEHGKTSGVFAGVSVNIGTINMNREDMTDYYSRIYDDSDIFDNGVKISKYTKKLQEILNTNFK